VCNSALHRRGHGTAGRSAGAVDDVLRADVRRGEVGAREQHRVGDRLANAVEASAGIVTLRHFFYASAELTTASGRLDLFDPRRTRAAFGAVQPMGGGDYGQAEPDRCLASR